MNAQDLASRLRMLEDKVEKLTPRIGIPLSDGGGTTVAGIDGALGIQLIGLTTAQRTALGIKLATLSEVKHILVFDTEKESFYTWLGTEWV